MSGEPPSMASPGGLAVIILAAGAGTRMKSKLPKPLHLVAGLPMIEHVFRAVAALDPSTVAVVASPGLKAALSASGQHQSMRVFVQDPPTGTGDAVLAGLRTLSGHRSVLVVYADHPLVSSTDLKALLAEFERSNALVGLMTSVVEDAAGYGRVERDEHGNPAEIVERNAVAPAERMGPTEINSGIQVLDVDWASKTLATLPPNPLKHEVFLTDLVEKAAADGTRARPVITVSASPETLQGVNDRAELAMAADLMHRRIRNEHMRAGVTIIGPETVFIDADVRIGPDTTILPFSIVQTGCSIGQRCIIGPGTTLGRSSIGDGSHVEASFMRDSRVGNHCHVGPFSHVRNETVLDDQVHLGNFVEAKNAHFASGVLAGHMSYLGDANIGEATNIGAGTVTCNFDGVDKHHTEIGANVFIGSDTMLVAPLTIGDGASTGAGSVVTRDVAPGAKVVGIPARPIGRRAPEPGGQNTLKRE